MIVISILKEKSIYNSKKTKMVFYSSAKIYTIRSKKTNMVYVGSTCQPLNKRKGEHVRKYKLYLYNKYSFTTSFDIIKLGEYYIELVEEFPCENKEQLLKREGEIIRLMPNCCNKIIAGRNQKDWRTDNKNKYKCEICNFCTENKEKLKRHFETKKHQNNISKIII